MLKIQDIGRLNFELSWFERQQQLESEHTDVVNKYILFTSEIGCQPGA